MLVEPSTSGGPKAPSYTLTDCVDRDDPADTPPSLSMACRQPNPAVRSIGDTSVAEPVKVMGLSVPARAFCEDSLTPDGAGETLPTLTLLDSTLLRLSPSPTRTLMSTGVGEIEPSRNSHSNRPLVPLIWTLSATSSPLSGPPQSAEAENVPLS